MEAVLIILFMVNIYYVLCIIYYSWIDIEKIYR